jgi:hypothetical protein
LESKWFLTILTIIRFLLIDNPPKDATDPQEWRDFFRENFDGAHATAVTVALDNDNLIRSLRTRREAMRMIEMLVEPGTSLDTLTLARLSAEVEQKRTFFQKVMALMSPGIPELYVRIAEHEAKIKGWAQGEFHDRVVDYWHSLPQSAFTHYTAQVEWPVSNVFVSFETEAAQRRVLSAFNLGSIAVSRNNIYALKDLKYVFRRGREDERVLKVSEPTEPSTIVSPEILVIRCHNSCCSS